MVRLPTLNAGTSFVSASNATNVHVSPTRFVSSSSVTCRCFFADVTPNLVDLQTPARQTAQFLIHHLLAGRAEYVTTEHIEEVFHGETVWSGDVATFMLTDHPSAATAYAWKETNSETGKSRLFAVLASGPIDSPNAAIRASIVKDFREGAN